MTVIKALAIFFLVAGFGTVFSARAIVRKMGLDKNVKCNFEHEMDEEDLERYKFDRAMVNVKMVGMLIAIPGLVFLFMGFR